MKSAIRSTRKRNFGTVLASNGPPPFGRNNEPPRFLTDYNFQFTLAISVNVLTMSSSNIESEASAVVESKVDRIRRNDMYLAEFHVKNTIVLEILDAL